MGARIFLGLYAILSAPFGIYMFFRPGSLEAFAGVAATSTTGTIELQAMHGGLTVALFVVAVLGAARQPDTRNALFTVGLFGASFGLARLLAATLAAEFSSYTVGGLAFELVSAGVAAALLCRAPR